MLGNQRLYCTTQEEIFLHKHNDIFLLQLNGKLVETEFSQQIPVNDLNQERNKKLGCMPKDWSTLFTTEILSLISL